MSAFQTYRAQAEGKLPSKVARARLQGVPASLAELASLEEDHLWALHAEARATFAQSPADAPPLAPAGASLLDLSVELAERLLGPCRLCFLRCPVDRRAGERGACGLGAELRPYQDFMHLGEELELIPTHAVFLAGCNYRCAYCSDWTHVETPEQHAEVSPQRLARSIEARRRGGGLSLSFVGGLPDVNLPAIAHALRLAQVSVPLVWNTNLSASDEAHDLLEVLVDVFVADLKYGNEACSQAGSAVKDALAVAQRQLRRVTREAYVIVRHLVLPGHVECCTLPVLDWLAEHTPGVRLNLMNQFLPPQQVAGTDWDATPTSHELERAHAHAKTLGLDTQGPGRLPSPPLQSTDDSAAAGFTSEIRIGPDGKVVIENLSADLSGLLEALGDHSARRLPSAGED